MTLLVATQRCSERGAKNATGEVIPEKFAPIRAIRVNLLCLLSVSIRVHPWLKYFSLSLRSLRLISLFFTLDSLCPTSPGAAKTPRHSCRRPASSPKTARTQTPPRLHQARRAKENSPAIHRWVCAPPCPSPVRDERVSANWITLRLPIQTPDPITTIQRQSQTRSE